MFVLVLLFCFLLNLSSSNKMDENMNSEVSSMRPCSCGDENTVSGIGLVHEFPH